MRLTSQMSLDELHQAFVSEAEQTWGADRMPELTEGLEAIAQQAYLLLQAPLGALDPQPDMSGWVLGVESLPGEHRP
jgi:hypothetical protein